jgi:hypothetical protein
VLDAVVVVIASGGVLSLVGVLEAWLPMERSKLLVYEDVMKLLRAEIAGAGSQSEWARQNRVNGSILNISQSSRRNLQLKVPTALWSEEITVYRRV